MKMHAISIVTAIALAMAGAGDVVQRVFVSYSEELTPRQASEINDDTESIQQDIRQASHGRKEIRFSDGITTVDIAHETHTAIDVLSKALNNTDAQRVMAWTDYKSDRHCGVATSPNNDADTETHGGLIFATCDNPAGPTHELLHALGAVNVDAPGYSGDGHTYTQGDIMNSATSKTCDATNQGGKNVIDCGQNSYFSINPLSGSWLLSSPEHNIALSRFLRNVSEQKEPEPPTDSSVSRVSGSNRFATAVEVSKDRFPDGAQTAYVANGSAFADSMTAASYDDGPLLLVGQNHIPDVVRNELNRLSVRYIKIVGGSTVVSSSVESELVEYAN